MINENHIYDLSTPATNCPNFCCYFWHEIYIEKKYTIDNCLKKNYFKRNCTLHMNLFLYGTIAQRTINIFFKRQ